MKRNRHPSSSDDSDTGSTSTSWSQHSKSQSRRPKGKKPSEVFRTDLITAMKLHDSYQLNTEDYYVLADSWRQEWEKGVQVPVSPHSVPVPVVRAVAEKSAAVMFTRPKKMIRSSGREPPVLGYVGIRTLAEGVCRYDLDEEDVSWLNCANEDFSHMGLPPIDELAMERMMEEFERCCYDNLSHAMETEEGLGIEYDEDVVCDVCQSPDGEDGNEMVFCDKCNICVHQACYGILKVPEGSWLCRICALGIVPKCQLCPKKGGAMKPTRSGTKWVHVSCALWIPEVSIGNPEKMEPITNISHIPSNRWALSCCLCKDRTGACIQCSAKSCRTAFHVTCSQRASLKMSTILTDADEVKFKSFCPEHSGIKMADGAGLKAEEVEQKEEGLVETGCRGKRKGRERATPDPPHKHVEGVRLSERKQRLQQLEDDFYRFVPAPEVATRLGLPWETVDFVFQYWKLKRRTNFNQPLITPKREEEESLARREQEVLLRRLRLFTHLRQDLERVRNLSYMVTRREKIKRSVCRVQEQIFQHHIKLLEQGRFSGLSTTRRLCEALFYFREAPSEPFESSRAFKGQLAPSVLAPPSTPLSPGPRLEKETQRGRSASRQPQSERPSSKPPKTNGILSGKAPRANGVLPSQVLWPNGTLPVRLAKDMDAVPEAEVAVMADNRRLTRGEATRAATAKPAEQWEKRESGGGASTGVSMETCPRVRGSGLPPGTPPHLVPTLRLIPVVVPPHAQIYNMEERSRRPRDPSPPARTKLRAGPRLPQEETITATTQAKLSSASSAVAMETRVLCAPAAVVTVTKVPPASLSVAGQGKYNGILRRSAPAHDGFVAPQASGSNARGWGSFRIPKKGERTTRGQSGGDTGWQEAESEPTSSTRASLSESPCPLPRRTSDRTLTTSAPALRTRLRVGAENPGNTKGAENGQSDADTQGKRCQAQRLRSHDIMARRYGSDIIRRGVLAS